MKVPKDRLSYLVTAYSYNNAEDKAMRLLIDDGYNLNVWVIEKVTALLNSEYIVHFI